jgi:hypothetical protein
MKVLLQPGDVLIVGFASADGHDEDGELVVTVGDDGSTISIDTDWPDSYGRRGQIYYVDGNDDTFDAEPPTRVDVTDLPLSRGEPVAPLHLPQENV